MRTAPLALLLLVALCQILVAPARAAQLTDSKFGFSITIPEGYTAAPAVTASNPDFLYAYSNAQPGQVGSVIIVERMRGTIGREKPIMPAGFKGKILTMPWQSFSVDAIELPETIGDTPIINYNVQIPLKPEAIQLRVVGPQADQAELLARTKTLLASLQGQSNWLASVAPPAFAEATYYPYVLLSAAGLLLIGSLVVWWLIRKRLPPGATLVIALAIYGASWALGPGISREARGGIGLLRLIGFVGVVLGIVDIFWRSQRHRPAKD